MPIKARTKRMIILTVAVVSCLIVSGMAFVSYFMHSVYEQEQLIDSAKVPAAVQRSFEKRFPGATEVVWESEDGMVEAEFLSQDKTTTEAIFTPDGTFARSVMSIRFSDLPGKARIYLESQDGYEVIEPERIDKAGLPSEFEAKLASKLMEWSCVFDAEGNLIMKTRDGPILE